MHDVEELLKLRLAALVPLAHASHLDKVAVNRATSRLKDRHLLRARPNVLGGRSHLLEFSDPGRQTLMDCSVALADFEQDALSGFGRDELDGIKRFIDRVITSMA